MYIAEMATLHPRVRSVYQCMPEVLFYPKPTFMNTDTTLLQLDGLGESYETR